MPVPIRSVFERMDKDKNSPIDYSFLAQYFNESPKPNRIVTASNKDAELMFNLWSKFEQDKEKGTIKIDSSVDPKDIIRLKTMGFITGNSEEVKITKKGQIVLTTMILSEPNRFAKEKNPKKYTEILASMDKRGKKGYRIPKFATNNSNNLRLG